LFFIYFVIYHFIYFIYIIIYILFYLDNHHAGRSELENTKPEVNDRLVDLIQSYKKLVKYNDNSKISKILYKIFLCFLYDIICYLYDFYIEIYLYNFRNEK